MLPSSMHMCVRIAVVVPCVYLCVHFYVISTVVICHIHVNEHKHALVILSGKEIYVCAYWMMCTSWEIFLFTVFIATINKHLLVTFSKLMLYYAHAVMILIHYVPSSFFSK